ncbi:MAG TPA: hypothetical protein VFQ36_09140 [Ktedonobacteraceae bacterium]|nr:hypothetical protein [Ktedonobacteraceae bacterium]
MPDLSTLPDGTRVFIDTNIFHFHFQGKSTHPGCMNRCILHRHKVPLSNIATMDGDFASIPGVIVWKPDEIA